LFNFWNYKTLAKSIAIIFFIHSDAYFSTQHLLIGISIISLDNYGNYC
jgi:hypothetical protein